MGERNAIEDDATVVSPEDSALTLASCEDVIVTIDHFLDIASSESGTDSYEQRVHDFGLAATFSTEGIVTKVIEHANVSLILEVHCRISTLSFVPHATTDFAALDAAVFVITNLGKDAAVNMDSLHILTLFAFDHFGRDKFVSATSVGVASSEAFETDDCGFHLIHECEVKRRGAIAHLHTFNIHTRLAFVHSLVTLF